MEGSGYEASPSYSLFSSSDVSVFGKEGFLVPQNTRQYLYKISPLMPVHNMQTSGKVRASTNTAPFAVLMVIVLLTYLHHVLYSLPTCQ